MQQRRLRQDGSQAAAGAVATAALRPRQWQSLEAPDLGAVRERTATGGVRHQLRTLGIEQNGDLVLRTVRALEPSCHLLDRSTASVTSNACSGPPETLWRVVGLTSSRAGVIPHGERGIMPPACGHPRWLSRVYFELLGGFLAGGTRQRGRRHQNYYANGEPALHGTQGRRRLSGGQDSHRT